MCPSSSLSSRTARLSRRFALLASSSARRAFSRALRFLTFSSARDRRTCSSAIRSARSNPLSSESDGPELPLSPLELPLALSSSSPSCTTKSSRSSAPPSSSLMCSAFSPFNLPRYSYRLESRRFSWSSVILQSSPHPFRPW